MNVIGARPTGWWRDRDGAARQFIGVLQRWVRTTGDEVTCVLDGRPLDGLPEGEHAGVRVLYARRPGVDAADDRIVEVVADDGRPETLRVITSDRGLRRRLEALHVEVRGASTLHRQLDALGG